MFGTGTGNKQGRPQEQRKTAGLKLSAPLYSQLLLQMPAILQFFSCENGHGDPKPAKVQAFTTPARVRRTICRKTCTNAGIR
ncbi:hypothetical protein B9T62_33960 [Paenibacillus donghaensis]|uniref:Uncharacterized protein n=1 Tax=Paenibacillus donghaensis TaxID=414771 RepID=A0A2Z2KVK3_9BACL|nr:hypothetical protein B9T62_33960 [Paenibacillus donghaensis]